MFDYFRSGSESTWREGKHVNSDGEDFDEKDSSRVRISIVFVEVSMMCMVPTAFSTVLCGRYEGAPTTQRRP